MAYLLDADVFIRAKNLHYGLDFCPAFWDWLVTSNDAGRVFSVEKVGDEVRAGADELSEWATDRGEAFFLRPDASVFPALAEVSEWVNGQAYEAAAVNTFLQVADLLARRAGTSRGARGSDARDSVRVYPTNQDSQCLSRARHDVHHAVRNAPSRTSTFRSRCI